MGNLIVDKRIIKSKASNLRIYVCLSRQMIADFGILERYLNRKFSQSLAFF